MQRLARFLVLVANVSLAGCGSDEVTPITGDLEWPPDATVYFDQYGVFNADCATDEDCAMALGYYHASERFVQMDVRRRFSTGRLADILIPIIAQQYIDDFASIRASFSNREGRPLEEQLIEEASPKTLALLQAYSAGVNKWLEEVKAGDPNAIFPNEFSSVFLDYNPEDVPAWTPQDCVASIIALIDSLTNDETEIMNAGKARAAINAREPDIGDDKFADLWDRGPLLESSILPPDWVPPSSSSAASKRLAMCGPNRPLDPGAALSRAADRLDAIDALRKMVLGAGVLGEDVGSNNWAVSGSRTASGNALLANDPHLGMTQPATWYLAHMDGKTNGGGEFHSAGVTFAGLPWILIGQNESIAWGMTTTNMDFTDVYVEEVVRDESGNATGVMFEGNEVDFVRVPWTVTFSDGTTHDFCDGADCEGPPLLFVPHHGPLRDISLTEPPNPEDDVALTLRWTGQEISTDINFLTELNRATTVEEARMALELMTTVGQNVVVVDTAGSIGWFPYNQLPKRTWATGLDGEAPPWLPLDGRSGDYEWDEYFELQELPQAMNPDKGYIATANNDMTGALLDGDPTTLPSGAIHPPYQVSAASGYRFVRIVDLIEDIDDQHTIGTMNQIISDVYSLIGEAMVPKMIEIAENPQTLPGINGLKVIEALKSWNFECPTGLVGPYWDSDLSDDPDELLASAGCAAFHVLLDDLRARIEENEFAPSFYDGDARSPSAAMYFSIVDTSRLTPENKDIFWDNPATMEVETKYQVMGESLQVVGDFLDGWLGSDEKTQWAWGRLHGLRLLSDIGGLLGARSYDNPASDDPLFANDGGLYTVDVAYPTPTTCLNDDVNCEPFVQTWGASTRFVCEALPQGPSCTIQLPGGQSGHLQSDNYEDLIFPYLENQPIPLVFDIAEAEASAVRTVVFQ
ncbi:MAG TPA: penicillin acylase family protein [Polyangiales bacterium]|nr:penicillin acylase family protein [Polyangiales bacterium]